MYDQKEVDNLIAELTADPDLYVNLKDLTERMVEIDNEYMGSPWNLLQILTNINMIIPRRIGQIIVKNLLKGGKK